MQNAQITAMRIKKIAKEKNISLSEMLASCGLGINTISKIAKGSDVLSKNLCKIADYLNCSMDYLLGRTNNPAMDEHLTEKEKKILSAYRENIDMQKAINQLLNVEIVEEIDYVEGAFAAKGMGTHSIKIPKYLDLELNEHKTE